METVFQICLSNTIVALAVAVAAAVTGAFGRRPALAHGLWVLVLIKLVTPPLVRVPLPPTPLAAASRSLPMQAPVGLDGPSHELRGPSRER